MLSSENAVHAGSGQIGRTFARWAQVVVLAVLVAACGGGGGSEAVATASAVVPTATVEPSTTATWPKLGDTESFTRDIPTCRVDASTLLMSDLARPSQAVHRRRAILFVHGGGWSSGSKAEFEPLMQRLAAQGFTGLSVDYRLSPAVVHPTHLFDVQCHLRWLRAHAALLDIDIDRIAVVGASAGAHLAALLAFDRDNGLRAAVLHGGPYDLRPDSVPENAQVNLVFGLLGTTTPTLAQLLATSPIFGVYSAGPPTLILHGRLDPVVPVAQAVGLSTAMSIVGQPHQLGVIEGAGHSDFGPTPDAVERQIFRLLEAALQ